jgi:glucose-1-phosphate cytidylyltransferase
MKVVILAGGKGTRISEESYIRPKPMVEIGGKPILWHIMKIYSHYGLNDFVICCGYKGYMIKEFFANYALRHSDITFDMCDQSISYHKNNVEPWRVTLVDTGEESMTGGRIRRIADHVRGEAFCCTYGDGVADIDIRRLIEFHREQKKLATLTAVQPEGRFGAFVLAERDTLVRSFREKPKGDGSWINGGYFVIEPEALDLIEHDGISWEQEPLRTLSNQGQLAAFRHTGFWHPMDTLRDKTLLESYWETGNPAWKVWGPNGASSASNDRRQIEPHILTVGTHANDHAETLASNNDQFGASMARR